MTKNKFEIRDGVIHIEIKNRDGLVVGVAQVDEKHAHIVLNKTWMLSWDGYAVTRKSVRMHRLISDVPKGLVVDHINHSKLDNRDFNLRICTRAKNSRNRSKQTGVFKRSDSGRWQAQIMVNYKNIRLGCYDSYEDAVEARQNAELQYFGEFGGGQSA